MAYNYFVIPDITYKGKKTFYRIPTITEMHQGPVNKDYKAIYYYKQTDTTYLELGKFCGIETKYSALYGSEFIVSVFKFSNEKTNITKEYEYLDNIYCIGIPDTEYDRYPMIQIDDMLWNTNPVFY